MYYALKQHDRMYDQRGTHLYVQWKTMDGKHVFPENHMKIPREMFHNLTGFILSGINWNAMDVYQPVVAVIEPHFRKNRTLVVGRTMDTCFIKPFTLTSPKPFAEVVVDHQPTSLQQACWEALPEATRDTLRDVMELPMDLVRRSGIAFTV
jgi:hypothetical protein